MPIRSVQARWDLSSTGASATVVPALDSEHLTFHCVAGGSSVTIGIEAGRTSTSPFARMGSTAYSIDANVESIIQLDGPLALVRPYLITGSTCTIELIGL